MKFFTSAAAPSRWAARSRRKIQLAHLVGVHPLSRKCAQTALQARIDLLLHQRLGNRKRIPLGERLKKPILGFALHAAPLAKGKVLADAGFEVGIGLVIADLLGKVVIQLGQGALLDSLYLKL